MDIGIFGGTFNPPHVGHLITAEHIREELGLDTIVFVPTATSPHKISKESVSPEHRLAMTRLATRGNSGFQVSDIEIRRGGVSFTIDTLHAMKQEYPNDRLFLLIGMDNLIDFHTWRSPEEIVRAASLVVMTRPGFEPKSIPKDLQGKISICPVPEIGIASRELRERVRRGKSIKYLVADEVHDYIYTNNLYV